MAFANCAPLQTILCFVVGVAAGIDGGACGMRKEQGGAECGVVEDESSSMLQVKSAKTSWTMWAGYNCYEGRGAATSEGPKPTPYGLEQCQALFSGHDGVVMDSARASCWGIRGVSRDQCVQSPDYDTWVKSGSSNGFCGAPCTTLTENSDCGGECGYCDGQMCINFSPPTPPTPPSYCGRSCTFQTEHQDCGGECGLCDGVMCTTGTAVPTPSPSGAWKLYAGYNCYDNGNGAGVSDGPHGVDGYPSCAAQFTGWDGVVMSKNQLQCWGIKDITKSECVTGDAGFDTYMA